MIIEEFNFSDKKIPIEGREDISSSFKINTYKTKLKLMEDKKIPQKNIKEVINHFFNKNRNISNKTKNAISKIIYCQKVRILVLITHYGKEIIVKRDRLIRDYGWFFFIEKSTNESKKKKLKKKEERNKEQTISTEEFHYDDTQIPLKQKEHMRALYRTKEYNQYLKLIKSKQVPQMSIRDVLEDLFFKDELVPSEEKKGIRKIIYYQKEKVIVIKSLIGDKMYENLEDLVKKYGWYLYITGIAVGKSEISIAIDKIERRFDFNYFKSLSLSSNLKDSNENRLTLYPIALRPNHNCIILGIGSLNILLDL